MVNKRCCCISFGSLFLLLGAALIVILGGVLKPLVNNAITSGVKDGLYINYANYNEKDRNDYLLDMKNYDFYFFNVTNVAQIRSNLQAFFLPPTPVKPTVQQLGPYTYRYYEYKTNVVISQSPTGDELISYNIWWFRNPVTGNTDNTDQVCTLNPIYMGGLNQAWQSSFYTADALRRSLGYPPSIPLDEYTIERLFFSLFMSQIPTLVFPSVVGGLTSALVSESPGFLPYYLGAIIPTLMGATSSNQLTILNGWRTNNATNAFSHLNSVFSNFEISVVTGYSPGPFVTAHLFDSTKADYSLTNATGYSNLLTLLGKLQAAGTNLTAAGIIIAPFANAYGYDFGNDTANPATEAPALLTSLGVWLTTVSTVTAASTTTTSPFLHFAFQAIASKIPEASTWTSLDDLSYAQLAFGAIPALFGGTSYLSLFGLFSTLGHPELTGPIVTHLSAASPLVANHIYTGANPNITYNGLELGNAGFPISTAQLKGFLNLFAAGSNGSQIYAGLYGAGLSSSGTLTAAETVLFSTLNNFGFNFALDNIPVTRQRAFQLHDYLGSTVTTFMLPRLVGSNSGILTCQTANKFINQGFLDSGTGFAFPGYFTDNNSSYTGAYRTYYTGKNNANIARMLYARENHTTIVKITDTAVKASSYCPKDLNTGDYVCQDLWAAQYGDAGLAINLNGESDFDFFGPFQDDESPRELQAYSSDLLRNVNLSYIADESIMGVNSRRYGLDPVMLQDGATNLVNANFRMDKAGIAPMKFANPLFGFTLSRPHFYGADASVVSSVNGLSTGDQETYETHLWLEPLTGAAIKGTKKLQGSFHMTPATYDERASQRLFTGGDIYWPSFWADEYAVLNDSQASDLKKIFQIRDAVKLLSPIGYGVGAGVFVIGLIMVVHGCKMNSGGSTQLKSSTTL